MQWLIDIILKLIPPGGGFVDRGDPAAADWLTGDFIADWTWRDLDCSAIVPEGATAILFYMQALDDLPGSDFQLRKKGNVNPHNRSNLNIQAINLIIKGDFVCPCDENRFVQYRAKSTVWTQLYLLIKGWW